MMFFRVASVPFKVIGGFDKFRRYAESSEVAANLIDTAIFEKLSPVYKISPDPKDYGFLSALAVRANVPNNNGDAISREELFRYRPHRGCRTFETFINSPLHINHFSQEPSLARGFIIDAIYNDRDEPFEFVEVVVAVDKTKDPYLADMLLSGKINKFSMGSLVEAIKCSLSSCGKVAHSEDELCDHLKRQRMQYVNGELVFGWNIGVDYEELSVVSNPAERFATTRHIFGGLPSHLTSFVRSLPARTRVGLMERYAAAHSRRGLVVWADLFELDDADRAEIADFLRVYAGRIPESVVRALKKVLSVVE
jgi:hypothetical protein